MFRSSIIPIKLAVKSIRANPGRTFLSLLGIVIGVASVILVLSLGAGVKNFVVNQVSAFGSNIMEIEVKTPKTKKASTQNIGGIVGGSQITTFKLDDAQKIAKLKNVGPWYAAIMSQQIMSYAGKNKQVYILGATAGITAADQKAQIESGTMFTDEDDNSLKQTVVLGSEIKNDFFGEQKAVGKLIKIKGQTYKVIGVFKKRGVSGFFNLDKTIFIPLKTVQKKIMGVNYIQFAIFNLRDMKKLDITMLDATDIMRRQHKITKPDDDDFSVNSIAEVMDILNKVFFTIDLLLLALASISLIVGGVGIMNVMYVIVAERIYEIGLKKAVGAREGNILIQFLWEAIFITLLGGIIGLFISFGVSKIGEIVAANLGFNLDFPITFWAAFIGVGFSAVTGIIFGYFPARNASKLSPMEALQKE